MGIGVKTIVTDQDLPLVGDMGGHPRDEKKSLTITGENSSRRGIFRFTGIWSKADGQSFQ
jgi:hypothetical protein